ncbi:MAG: Fic family protein [Alcanivoracaceae bacterium]|nr:Fic family protein [Alcanivoracaceae bacterium]
MADNIDFGLILYYFGRIMKKIARKLNILKLLQFRGDWLGISTMLSLLGDPFKERTVRRLLSELKADGLILRSGRGPSTRYRVNSANQNNQYDNHIKESDDLSGYVVNAIFSSKALHVIEAIRKPIFHRIPVSYKKQWVDSYIPNETFYFSEQQRAQMAESGNRSQLQGIEPAGTYSRKILNRLLIDLSYNSSRLEGNTYSKLDTEKLLIQGLKHSDKLDEERVMILNHKDAIEYLVRNAGRLTVSYKTICTLHYLLADGLLPIEYMGKVRNERVRIGQSTYQPLEDKLRLESYLKNIIVKALQIQNPYEQSLFLLVQLAYLQPFMDVNKRTARLSANIALIKSNKVPLSFNELDKDDYISAMLAVYELNQVSPMVDLYYHSYLRTCQAYDATVESVGFDPIRVKYRRQRRDLIAKIIRELLFDNDKENCIKNVCTNYITNDEQQLFIESLEDELCMLTINTIAGLGISQTEFERWQRHDSF